MRARLLLFGIAVARNGKTVLAANASGSGIAYALWSGGIVKTYATSFVEPMGAASIPRCARRRQISASCSMRSAVSSTKRRASPSERPSA